MRNKCDHRSSSGEKFTSSHRWEGGICGGPYAEVMPTREQVAEAIFNASMPHGLSVTWAKLTNENVRDQNTRVIEERLKWADAVLALFGDMS